MAAVAEAPRALRAGPAEGPAPRDRRDLAWAFAWLAIAFVVRLPLVARVEGMLDHDQAVVGLMALDIAEGRRLPIFFDGQRYMGAVEAYVAAAFVAALGHRPEVVALAPALFFGLFAAGQYLTWRRWADRATGHLAALLTVAGPPMLALWGVIPRGGYSEILAWSLPTLAAYRAATRSDAPTPTASGQAGWGFLLAFGYFLNPLAIIVYATLAVDWTLGRHGADLRRERGLDGGWVDARRAPWTWAALGGLALAALAVACHVEPRIGSANGTGARYVFLLGALPNAWSVPIAALIIVLVLGLAAWWTGAAHRLAHLAATRAAFGLGALAALVPFVAYNLRARLVGGPRDLSLPIWIRAPWDVGPNLRDGLGALGPLIGGDAHAVAGSLSGHPAELTIPDWTTLTRAQAALAPATVLIVAALVATVAWRDRRAWRAFWTLRGDGLTPPTVLALIGLATTVVLYMLQTTSYNVSSVRYLLMAWVFLPGVLVCGLRAWPANARAAALAVLLLAWTAGQYALWRDMDRPSPLRPLVAELERRGVAGVVTSTPLALHVANFSHGRVGALEYHSGWPRLHDRYAGRFDAGGPITLLTAPADRPGDPDTLDRRIDDLARRHPGRVRPAGRVGVFAIWEADVPLAEVMAPAVAPPLAPRDRFGEGGGPSARRPRPRPSPRTELTPR